MDDERSTDTADSRVERSPGRTSRHSSRDAASWGGASRVDFPWEFIGVGYLILIQENSDYKPIVCRGEKPGQGLAPKTDNLYGDDFDLTQIEG